MKQPKVKLYFLIFIYFLVGIVFLWLSWGRSSLFAEHIENFSRSKGEITFFGLIFLFSSYFLLFFDELPIKLKSLKWFLLLLVILYFLIPPFFSRDAAAYLITAKNFLWFGLNPYISPVGNPINPWAKELGSIWWLKGASPYGPLFFLIILPAVLPKLTSLIATIYLYKIIVIAAYLLCIYLIGLLVKESKKEKTILLFILNPTILIHVLIEGRNEIFILLALLTTLYFLKRGAETKSFLSFLASFFLKFYTAIFLPIFWFAKGKILWFRILMSLAILGLSIYFFPLVFHLNLTGLATNFFLSSSCMYTCSPVIALNQAIFGNLFNFGPKILFLIAYLYVFYCFLIKKIDFFKFIFWSFVAFSFLGITWLTPWYLVLIIPMGLLIEGRLYQIMTLFLTFYSLFHYFGV